MVVGLALAWDRIWPFTEKAVVEDLAEASDSTKASSVRTDLYSSSAVPTTSAAKNGKYRADAASDWCSIHDWT